MHVLGNTEILSQHKTAFLCSRRCPAGTILKIYDWAIDQREKGQCIISGFHSILEKDVLHYLLKGKQPVILALARGMKKRIDPELQKAVDKGRLLIVTPFSVEVTKVTPKTAQLRNAFMVSLAEEIVVGYANPNGAISRILDRSSRPVIFIEKPVS